MPTQDHEENTEVIGELLTYERKKRGLSVDSVAVSLYFPREIIVQLEAENWSYFPRKVFAKGYLRAYCLFLEIDYIKMALLVDKKYQDLYETKPTPITKGDKSHTNEKIRKAIRIGGTSLVLVLILYALISLWIDENTKSSPPFDLGGNEHISNIFLPPSQLNPPPSPEQK